MFFETWTKMTYTCKHFEFERIGMKCCTEANKSGCDCEYPIIKYSNIGVATRCCPVCIKTQAPIYGIAQSPLHE